MRNLLFIVLLFISYGSFGQISLNYYWEQRDEAGGLSSVTYHSLVHNGSKSLFSKADSTQKLNPNVIQISSNQFKGFYFDIESNTYYYMGFILGKPFPVIDQGAALANKWNLVNEEGPMILGYPTKKATMHFRGRDYIAFFAPDLPFNTGPFKFSGLPGVILEIFTVDNSHSFKASSINLNNQRVNIDNPYKDIKKVEFHFFL